jgi:hypothetical protein
MFITFRFVRKTSQSRNCVQIQSNFTGIDDELRYPNVIDCQTPGLLQGFLFQLHHVTESFRRPLQLQWSALVIGRNEPLEDAAVRVLDGRNPLVEDVQRVVLVAVTDDPSWNE